MGFAIYIYIYLGLPITSLVFRSGDAATAFTEGTVVYAIDE